MTRTTFATILVVWTGCCVIYAVVIAYVWLSLSDLIEQRTSDRYTGTEGAQICRFVRDAHPAEFAAAELICREE